MFFVFEGVYWRFCQQDFLVLCVYFEFFEESIILEVLYIVLFFYNFVFYGVVNLKYGMGGGGFVIIYDIFDDDVIVCFFFGLEDWVVDDGRELVFGEVLCCVFDFEEVGIFVEYYIEEELSQ